MKRLSRQLALTMLCLLGAQRAWACYAAPSSQTVGVDELIASASTIAVAKVVRATPAADGRINYEFVLQRRLAGPVAQTFSLTASEASALASDTSFDYHKEPAFWAHGGGRLMNHMDCKLYPAFVVGDSYLLFGSFPATRRSAEKVESGDDKWLRYVEAALEQRRKD